MYVDCMRNHDLDPESLDNQLSLTLVSSCASDSGLLG